jgi:hypothetical protein
VSGRAKRPDGDAVVRFFFSNPKNDDTSKNIAIQKKLKWIFTLSADDIDSTTDTNKMPCSICHQNGHNKRTCQSAPEGMEDCFYCGYTHHDEDKCPNEATAHHYKKWRVDEEEEEEEEIITCPRCDRTEKECEEQAEDKDNKNPITDWRVDGWGLSCDECYYKAHPESDEAP